jgi:hypothetical protein
MASQAVTPEKIAPLDQRPSPKFSHSSERGITRENIVTAFARVRKELDETQL